MMGAAGDGEQLDTIYCDKNKEELLGIQDMSIQTVTWDSSSASPSCITLLGIVGTQRVC